ncbi:MAG TPA: DUF2752 domain-containing protein [Thermoanaerobaculia bacterium]
MPSVGFAAFLIAARLFSGSGLQGFCLFHLAFGVECPGCGITRSVLALFAGRVSESWQIQRAGIAVAVYFLALAILALLETLRRVGPHAAARFRWSADRCFAVILIANWLCRIVVVHISGT